MANKRRRRPLRNEYSRRPPKMREIRDAIKLAKKVSKDLAEMMEAVTPSDVVRFGASDE